MRVKTKLFLLLGVVGGIILVLALIFNRQLPDLVQGCMSGIGSAMFGLGIAKYAFGRYEEKNPQQMRQDEIEAKDERNVAIRYRAQAVSGLVLQWMAIGIAWILILADGPLWITLTAVGIFVGKTVLDSVLMEYYQRKM